MMMPIIIMLHHFQLRRSDSRLHPMDAVSRQEILIAYLCFIGTVALFLWRSRVVSGRDDCGPPRAGQSEPAPRPRAKLAPAPASRGAVYAQSAFSRRPVICGPRRPGLRAECASRRSVAATQH